MKHHRSIYTFLDFLGDVGGLLDGLKLIGGLLVSAYTFIVGNPLNAYLVNALFKRGKIKKRSNSNGRSIFEKI